MQILILNQYFPPDLAATGQLLGQLAEELSKHHEVTVICGKPTYAPDPSSSPDNTTFSLHRIPLLPTSRSNILFRMFNYLLFFFGSFIQTFFCKKPELILCWTDPPILGLIAAFVAKMKNSKFIFVSQDVYPDVVIAANRLNNPITRFLLQAITQLIYKFADAIVVIGNDMEKNLTAKGVPKHKIHLIQNWQDSEFLKPISKEQFRKDKGLPLDSFIIMHSGNVGFSQDFKTFISAAENLKSDPNFLFVIIGDGASLSILKEEVQTKNLSNVLFFPYQPKSDLSASLSGANLHYVSLKPEFVGKIVPSKIFGIMSVAKPMIGVVPNDCDISNILIESGAGKICEPNGKDLSDSIVQLSKENEALDLMGQKGLEWISKHSTRKLAAEKYLDLIVKVTPRKSPND